MRPLRRAHSSLAEDPGLIRRQFEGSNAIGAVKGNFPRRSGRGQIHLAGPLTVTASAREGKITLFLAEE